jgi:hypothetical protein
MAIGGAIMLWPKPVEPPEIMTLLIWGPPNEDAGTIQWIHGKASQEQALQWKVWQPPGYKLKHRFVIEGRPIGE